MDKIRKEKLINLSAEVLADALLDLARRYEPVDGYIEQMLASPDENIKRFKNEMARLKRSRRFVRWGESTRLARELESLLEDIKGAIDDPLAGVELLISFYETDTSILGHCDDSSGHVGDVYRYHASELFTAYASRCNKKEKIVDLVLKLNKKDDYGVRDALINCAQAYLSEPKMRQLITKLQKLCSRQKDEFKKRHIYLLIESLARQVKDARLFEETRIASWGNLSTAAYIDISRIWLESGDAETALSWIEKIAEGDTYMAHEQNELRMDIYRALGDEEALTKVLYTVFRRHRSLKTLNDLLEVLGEEKRDEVVSKAVNDILAQPDWRSSEAKFLIALGYIDEAEVFLLKHAEQLNGHFYSTLSALSDAMEAEKRFLAVTLIYRCLLTDILDRGYTKAYPHGVRYFKKLDQLAVLVTEWQRFDNHDTFKETLHDTHGRKRSFWSRYHDNQ